jgi:ABC-2 type transport system ATP-binding protein
MIVFEKVTRNYGRKVAVADLDLEVHPGELLAFLGPNGAGKTTTIRMLVGLLRPTAGRIRVCGHDAAAQTREATRFIGYVPDESHLYEKLSGREFLQFVAEMRGLSRSAGQEAIARQTEQFGLEDFLDDLVESYSHGMKQRLVFASALLHDPPVLVVDEPTVGLDPRSLRLMKDLLRARAASGLSVFMSTHTLSIAEEIATRIAIIDRGRMNFLGTLEQLRGEMSLQRQSLEHIFLELTAEENPQGNHRGGGSGAAASPAPRAE